MPVAHRRRDRRDASGGTDLGDQRGDLLKQVAAPSELVGELGVAYVGRAVDPVARLRVAARLDQASAFPFTQGGWADAEPSGQGADERVAAFLPYGIEVANGGFDGLEGAPVVEKLGVTLVDEPKRVLGGVPVDRLHDQRGRLVAVSRPEGEERAQGLRVPLGVGAVAMRGAFSGRKDPGRLVVADRLRGQTVPARQVNRPELATALKVSPHRPANINEKFSWSVQRYR